MAEPSKPYKITFHWSKDDRTGKLTAVSCDEENIPGEQGFLAHFSHFIESFKGGLQAACLTVNTPNTLQLKKGGFLYMDIGCWLNGKQTFGLICGEDAVVCSYTAGHSTAGQGGAAASGGGNSLLDQFIHLPGVSVMFQEKIPSPQPDPQRLCLILPDMHVPDSPPLGYPRPADDPKWGKTEGGAWDIDPQTFDELSKRDLFNSRASIPAMIDFLSLVQGFGHTDQITLVQLGDMYELWAGREPEFRPSSDSAIHLLPSGAKEVGEWIGRTHQRCPELFQAFDHCADKKISMLFLHGNHDDYLSRPEVAAAANAYIQAPSMSFGNSADPNWNPMSMRSGPQSTVYPRHPEINQDHIFVEHGQRCDPYNRDGAIEGFKNANLAADRPYLKKLGSTERAMFVVSSAAMWCVKERNFGVYVMGHTHQANLRRVEVYHKREGDYVVGPEGVTVKQPDTPLEGTE